MKRLTNFSFTYLTRQNIAKSRKCVIKSFVVDALVQFRDKNIAHSRLSEGWITLVPRYSDWSPFDDIEVHGI